MNGLLPLARRACFLVLLAYAAAGCVAPKCIKPEEFPLSTDPRMKALDGTWHSVRILQATNTPVVTVWNRINPVWWFGNADQPKPPADYLPGRRFRNLRWHIRNPIHNFGHYVIGLGDKALVRSGRYPARLAAPRAAGPWRCASGDTCACRLSITITGISSSILAGAPGAISG